MKLILAGSTGFLGNEVLRQALLDDAVEEVLLLVRRPHPVQHPKVKQVQLASFLDYSSVDLAGYDACVWSLGVTQGTVNEAEFITITVDYTLACARALFAASPQARFCYVSGKSATPDESGGRLSMRIKGRAERLLGELSDNVFVVRPAWIEPTARSGPRYDASRYFTPLLSFVGRFVRDFSVDCDHLAAVLLDLAKHGAPDHLLRNAELRAWARR